MPAPYTVQTQGNGASVSAADGAGNITASGSVTVGAELLLAVQQATPIQNPYDLQLLTRDGKSLTTVAIDGTVGTIGTGSGVGGTPDWFNVKSYGATGNGTTDDTKAINAAMAAANTQGGGTVYLPWGSYMVSGTISIPPFVTLRGQTEITLNQGTVPAAISRIFPAASWAPSSSTGIVSFLSKTPGGWSVNAAASGMKNIFIDGSTNANTNLQGINYVGPVYDTHLEDVFVFTAGHNGITASGQSESGITPTFPYHQRYDRVSVVSSANTGFNLVNFTDSKFNNCLGFGNVGNNFGLQNNSNAEFNFCGAEWSSGGRGFDITGSSGSIVFNDCTTDQNFSEGLRIHSATGQTTQGGGIVWNGGKLHADGNGGTNNNGIVITGSTVPIIIDGVNVESGQNPNNSNFYPANAINISTSSNITVTGSILQGISSAWNDGGGNTRLIRTACLGATGNPNTQTFTILPNLIAGTNTAQGAPVLTPTFANGVAAQLSDTTQDYMVYLDCTTSGTATTIAIGPTSGVANTLVASASFTAGTLYTVRLPAGWFLKWAGTTTAFATQTAIGC